MNDVDIKWIKNKEEALQYYMNRMKKENNIGVLVLLLLDIIIAPILIIHSFSLEYRYQIISDLIVSILFIIVLWNVAVSSYKTNLNKKEDFSYYDYLKNKNKPKKEFKLI